MRLRTLLLLALLLGALYSAHVAKQAYRRATIDLFVTQVFAMKAGTHKTFIVP